MCGIWMVASRSSSGLFVKDASVALQMMRYTSLRGDHSTGIAITDYKDASEKAKVWKVVGGPDFLIQNKVWEDIDKYIYQRGGAVFGHGRFATKGNITAKNAHPFTHKHITLVHNGTFHSGVAYEKAENEQEVEVDSHALCIKIAQVGIEKALTEAKGAYAVFVHDQNNKAIWIARNSERPLYFAETSDRLFMMSEKLQLESILDRNNIRSNVQSLLSDFIFKLDLKTYQITKEVDLFKKKYPVATYNNPTYEHPTYERPRTTYYGMPKKKVTFIVESIENNGTEYVYRGSTEDKQVIEFRTNAKLENLIGKIGTGEVSHTVHKPGGAYDFIRYREIEWQEETAEADKPEDLDAVVESLNRKKLKLRSWRSIIKSGNCGACDSPIEETDIALTVIRDDGNLICKNCVGSPEHAKSLASHAE